jgi:putative SOS response-associated peptidase YedK
MAAASRPVRRFGKAAARRYDPSMCGRYSITTAPEALRRLFDFHNLPNLAARYNVAPTQAAPIVRLAADGPRELAMLRWGLVPHWAKDASIASRLINARAETVTEKPAFRDAFRHRRCLVPADGFYEWREEAGKRQPFRIGMKGGAPFAFAGLWESWTAKAAAGPVAAGETVETFAIVTTDANAKLRPIHPRMPVILAPGAYDAWLDASVPAEDACALLGPYPDAPMAFYRVSTRVNSVRNDDADCIAPLAATG